jgi:hypothetical protein
MVKLLIHLPLSTILAYTEFNEAVLHHD